MLNSKVRESKPPSILIIEDNPMTLDVFKTKLEIDGYHVDLASDGMAGFEKAITINPDLVLLDLRLPRLNGLEVLAGLRKNPKTITTPIIILTNWEDEEDIRKARELGANDFLLKSNITPKEVVAKIRKFLPASSTEDEFLSIPIRYHVRIQSAQGSASQLARDYEFDELFSCPKCGTTVTLDLVPDGSFIGKGHRFFAQLVCYACSEVF